MSGDVLRKPTSGEPFYPSARMFGAFIDNVHETQALKRRLATPQPAGGNWIWVQNNSGALRQRGEILQPAGVLITPATSEETFIASPTLNGATPTVSDFAALTLLQPLNAGDIGKAAIIGPAVVRVDGAGTLSDRWAPVAGEYVMRADGGGMRALYVESGSTERWALVLLNAGAGFAVKLVKTASGGHAAGATTAVDIYGEPGDTVGSESDAGTTLLGFNRGEAIGGDVFCSAWLWPWGVGTGAGGADEYEIFPITCNSGASS